MGQIAILLQDNISVLVRAVMAPSPLSLEGGLHADWLWELGVVTLDCEGTAPEICGNTSAFVLRQDGRSRYYLLYHTCIARIFF